MNLGSSNATQKAWLGVEEPWVHLSLQECLRQSPLRGGSFSKGKPTAGTSPLLVGLQLGSVFLIPGLPPSHSDQSLPPTALPILASHCLLTDLSSPLHSEPQEGRVQDYLSHRCVPNTNQQRSWHRVGSRGIFVSKSSPSALI